MKDEKLLTEYSRMIDDFSWHNKGDIFAIAKAAKELGRDYMEDIAERKKQLIDSGVVLPKI